MSLITPSYIDFTQIATPSNPVSLHNRLYFKADGHLYKLTSAGSEVVVDGGGSGGVPAGTSESIQFNTSGSFDYDQKFNYDKSTHTLFVDKISGNAGSLDTPFDGIGDLQLLAPQTIQFDAPHIYLGRGSTGEAYLTIDNSPNSTGTVRINSGIDHSILFTSGRTFGFGGDNEDVNGIGGFTFRGYKMAIHLGVGSDDRDGARLHADARSFNFTADQDSINGHIHFHGYNARFDLNQDANANGSFHVSSRHFRVEGYESYQTYAQKLYVKVNDNSRLIVHQNKIQLVVANSLFDIKDRILMYASENVILKADSWFGIKAKGKVYIESDDGDGGGEDIMIRSKGGNIMPRPGPGKTITVKDVDGLIGPVDQVYPVLSGNFSGGSFVILHGYMVAVNS